MAGRINDEDIQSLRDSANLASIVAEYTSLRPAGSRLKGLCPFHSEKTPSFTVDAARGYYHCFGCGEGGDVYGFLQRIEALSFPEAVERLARIEGYQLRYEELSPGQRRALGRRTRLAECLAETARYFEAALRSPEGEAAREYLEGRGVSETHAARFRVGWAPDRWDGLVRHLAQEGFSQDEMVDAGVASRGQRGAIDRFRGRVVFPILDAGGRDVVAFGGRVLPGVELQTNPRGGEAPKYINSPETEVYKKSRTLYALNWARGDVQRRDTALVVEGYMDVIGLHTAGVAHAVATCGTALTTDHFRLLEKFARRVVLALDADEAGFAAADRARALAEEVGLREVGVLPLPAGEDPADLAAAGAARVEEALTGVQTAVEFQIGHLLRGADVSTPEGQVDAYRRTFPLLMRLEDRFLRFTYVRDIVAPAVRLSADLIESELDAELRGGAGRRRGQGAITDSRDAVSASSGPGNSPGETRTAVVARSTGAVPRNPQLHLERLVLQAGLQMADLSGTGWDKLSEDDFTSPAAQQLFVALTAAPRGDLHGVLAALPDDDARARVRGLALAEPSLGTAVADVADMVARLRAAAIQRRQETVRRRLTRLNQQLDAEERRRLTGELVELERRQRDLLEGREA